MGNNAAFTQFEATVIAVYDRGVLDAELLKALAEPYWDSDIDSGGRQGIQAKDGLELEQVVLRVMGIEVPVYPKEGSAEQVEAYWDDLREKFWKVRRKTFGW